LVQIWLKQALSLLNINLNIAQLRHS